MADRLSMKIKPDRLTATPTSFEFEGDSAWWRASLPAHRDLPSELDEPFRVSLQSHQIGEDIFVEGWVEGALEVECSRCLARYRHTLREPFRIVLEAAGQRQPTDPEAVELKTARDTIAAPYEVDNATLTGWSLVLTDPDQPGVAMLGLQPPPALAPGLFDQVFKRTMESMVSPGVDILPVVLHSEFRSHLRAVLAPAELLQAARDAGLEAARLEPVCMGVKREPFAGRSRQIYFVLFDAPVVAAFRRQLGRIAADGGGFGATSFDLVLPVGGSDAGFADWFPISVDRGADCQAPLL